MPAVGRRFCVAGALLGVAGLVGWIAGVPFLTSIVPGQPLMAPNTCVALLLVGMAGALVGRTAGPTLRRTSHIAASMVLVLGVGTLAEYAFVTDLAIDQLFLPTWGPVVGRMSPPTACAFTLLALALLVDARSVRAWELLVLLTGAIGMIALTGMVLGAAPLYRVHGTSVRGVALPTGVALICISLGMLLQRPDTGLMAIATSRGLGGVMLRRLIFPTILSPPILAVVVTRVGEGLGLGASSPLEVAVLAAALSVSGLLLLAITAAALTRADGALRTSEEKFSGIVAIAPEAIISIGEDQRITIFNEAAQQIFGWAPEEVVGGPIDVLIPERFRERHRQHIRAFGEASVKAKKVVGERGRIFGLRKNGEEFPAEAAISKLPLDEGRIFTVALRDITDRVRDDREQQFLAELSATLAGSLDFAETQARVARLVARYFKHGCIVEITEDATMHARRLVFHSDPVDSDVYRALDNLRIPGPDLLQEVMAMGQPHVIDVAQELAAADVADSEHIATLRALDPLSILVVPMFARRGALGTLAFIATRRSSEIGPRDLAFAKEVARRAALALENARMYETAQRAIRARDDVLGIVVHDLRNPLATIIMASEQEGPLHVQSDRRIPAPAERIHRAATRMFRLIDDLLDASQLETGELTVKCEDVDVADIVSEVVDSQKTIAAKASLELCVDIRPDIPAVLADRQRLQQIFENLVGNAIKFTKAGGTIRVGAKHENDEVLFWVSDTGKGIAPDQLPHVFERFWQAEKGERRGAGLGLPICRGLVEAHGGRIWVESTLGRGTTFFFTIPVARHRQQRRVAAGGR